MYVKRQFEVEGSNLSTSFEFLDHTTRRHSARVAALATVLCDNLNVAGRMRDDIVLSAHLHDIGKGAIPSAILLKRTTLTAEELRLVRAHTQIGAHILRNSAQQIPATVALRHHEAWDGSGYPDGLKGESIPFAARVIGICNAYCLLRENRSYRKGLKHLPALEMLLNGDDTGCHRPSMFDPALLEVLGKCHLKMSAAAESVPL